MTQPRLLGDRYELEGVVGRGGMAEVYRARDIRLDRVVAIKTLRADLARDQTFQARFRREAQSAASLNNPAIVAVYDTGEDMATGVPIPYIVMEYVDGRTVRDLLVEGHRLLPERALEITSGVLRALEYSHQAGIIHRDIKPGNVMVTRNGDIKVMDFGIARAMGDAQATMTQTAQVIGTAQYLSPEQARGERVDARSDLYSTGCVLYELLTGRPPFTGDSPVAIAYQHVRENPVPPSQVDPEVPRWADAIVLKAMAKSPADRYQSAAEMQADIQRAASGMQVAAMPPPPTRMDYYGGGMPTRADQTAMMGGQTTAIPPYEGGYDEYGYDDGSGGYGRRRRWIPWVIGLLLVLGAAIAAAYVLLSGGGGGNNASVPMVTGELASTAEQQIVHAGLKYKVNDQSSSTVPRNHVISANPTDGSSIAKGQTVTLNVSTGAGKVKIPTDLYGKSSSAAQNEITSANLQVGQITTDNSCTTQAASTVEKTNPIEGALVNAGTPVNLILCGGTTTLPNVTGETLKNAETTLKAAGFDNISVQYENEPGAAGGLTAGTVWNQNPNGNQNESTGTQILLTVQQTTVNANPSGNPSSSASPSASASPSPNPSQSSANPNGH
jgi:beta-lactam-binding protein with PASTA domain/tRNA A-37 threonylcarbamoyl transferase component Bud32